MWKLLVDFGLVILIWMTQLVVYPSFTYYAASDLVAWHQRYTTAISILVMPLMLGQLVLHGSSVYSSFSMLGVMALVLIALAWINTFFFAVPLHNKIGAGQEVMESAQGLVKTNWYRTVLWSAVFVISLLDYLRTP